MMRKMVIVMFGILILSSFASAGFFDWFGNITGKATSDTTTLTITVGNNAPVISGIQTISAQAPTELGVKNIVFNFNVTDADGVGNIDDTSASVSFERGGEVTRVNNSCVWVSDHAPNTAQYSCSVGLWYFDGSGAWTINVSAEDINGAEALNASTTFIYNQLTSMVMSPTALAWNTLSLSDVNVGSTNDPIVVNNTGNDINLGIDVTSLDLQGLTTTSEYIYAENFSVGVSSEGCSGTIMVNNVATGVATAIVQNGNNTLNNKNDSSGQEEIFICLKGLPQDISSQDYSSAGTGPWTIQIIT